MPLNWSSVWTGFTPGVLIGYGSRYLFDLLKDQLHQKRDRDEARRVRHAEFQRVSLLNLQEAAGDLASAAVDSARGYADLSVGRPTDMSPVELDRAFFKAHARVSQYASRVDDGSIYDTAMKFRERCSEASRPVATYAYADAQRALFAAAELQALLDASVRAALRGLENNKS